MTQFIRRTGQPVVETVTLPEGYMICPLCKGKAYLSKYEMGWTSVVDEPELAALRQCIRCGGEGFIPKDRNWEWPPMPEP